MRLKTAHIHSKHLTSVPQDVGSTPTSAIMFDLEKITQIADKLQGLTNSVNILIIVVITLTIVNIIRTIGDWRK